MNDEHKTHNAHELSQMDNADQVNARENKNGAAATTTATPDDEHPKDSTFRELSKDDTRYILYHMDPKEWDGMSTDQRKALLETLHPADKRALASFNLRPDDLAVMPLQTARGVLRASIINAANGIFNKTVYPDLPPEVKADSKELEIILGREVAKLLHDPEYSARLDLLVKYHQGYRELEPFLKKAVKGKDFQGRTLDDIVTDSVQNHNDVLGPGMDMDDPTTELGRLFAAAREMAFSTIKTIVKKPTKIFYPLDKVNDVVWKTGIIGNDCFGINTLGEETDSIVNPEENPPILWGVDFDQIPESVTKNLTEFDKLVYVAANAIYEAGNRVTTLTQIYKTMGNDGRPSAVQLQEIHNSLEKMMATRIHLDNEIEAGKQKKQHHVVINDYLLPGHSATIIQANGKITEEGIAFYFNPQYGNCLPLAYFSHDRKQITAISPDLLKAPISKTEANETIRDYLITRISRLKNNSKAKKGRLLFDTIYRNTGIETKMQKVRSKKKITTYLDDYKKNKFISKYTIENDGITIYWK